MLIERRLRSVGLRQDAVDPHGPHTLLVEQAIGGGEQTVADADFRGFRSFPCFLRHLLTIQTVRSIINAMYRLNDMLADARIQLQRSDLIVARPTCSIAS